MVWSAKVFVVDSVTATSYYLGYLLWNGSVEEIASLVVSYVLLDRLLGLVEHFWTNAEFCAQAGWLILNGILISAIRHKGIGKTFTALNLLKTFGIAFFSTAFLCDFSWI